MAFRITDDIEIRTVNRMNHHPMVDMGVLVGIVIDREVRYMRVGGVSISPETDRMVRLVIDYAHPHIESADGYRPATDHLECHRRGRVYDESYRWEVLHASFAKVRKTWLYLALFEGAEMIPYPEEGDAEE